MNVFEKKISLRWADLDPNFHMRHSVYYDFGAEQRVEILEANGLTLKYMKQHHLGPILFREECIFRREIQLGDEVMITAKVAKLKADASRWSIEHQFVGNNNKLLATLTVDGAWIDTNLRKLASPIPQLVIDVFNAFPKAENFVLI